MRQGACPRPEGGCSSMSRAGNPSHPLHLLCPGGVWFVGNGEGVRGVCGIAKQRGKVPAGLPKNGGIQRLEVQTGVKRKKFGQSYFVLILAV